MDSSAGGTDRPNSLPSSGGRPSLENDDGRQPVENFSGWREAAPDSPSDTSTAEIELPSDVDDDMDFESAVDVPDALDVTSEFSSDSDFVPSDDSDDSDDDLDDDLLSLAPTASLDGDARDDEEEAWDDEWDEEPSYEWMLDDEFYQPGQPSGMVIVSPNELEVSLEVLGGAFREGRRVTRYFVRVDENRRDADEMEREE